MMTARLASAVLVSALLRMVERQSGFGTVIHKGDAEAGAILIVLAERGTRVAVRERLLRGDGIYAWDSPLAGGHNESDIDKFLERRRKFDPDIWLIELDIPSAERFAAEMNEAI